MPCVIKKYVLQHFQIYQEPPTLFTPSLYSPEDCDRRKTQHEFQKLIKHRWDIVAKSVKNHKRGSANPGRAGGHAGAKHEAGGVDRQKSSNDQARSTHGGGEHARPTGERNRQRRRTRGGSGGSAQG
jgi:hypothetical protein